jgi:hypothetical protein
MSNMKIAPSIRDHDGLYGFGSALPGLTWVERRGDIVLAAAGQRWRHRFQQPSPEEIRLLIGAWQPTNYD